MLARWDWGQVDVDLHRRQRFNLAPCPASLPLPQAAGRADAQPTIAPGFADDPFIVVDVGDASHCDHASLQHLCVYETAFSQTERVFNSGCNPIPDYFTWTCCFEGSWTIAVPFTLRSKTPLVPENQMKHSVHFSSFSEQPRLPAAYIVRDTVQ